MRRNQNFFSIFLMSGGQVFRSKSHRLFLFLWDGFLVIKVISNLVFKVRDKFEFLLRNRCPCRNSSLVVSHILNILVLFVFDIIYLLSFHYFSLAVYVQLNFFLSQIQPSPRSSRWILLSLAPSLNLLLWNHTSYWLSHLFFLLLDLYLFVVLFALNALTFSINLLSEAFEASFVL